ncbi:TRANSCRIPTION FACTOR GTE11 [Salix koriyanagi]|uniref:TRANSCRIPTION FACTOR GTE11 n=2 Tax=Salix koriyanagi TaxID=2511006 RepID=A0A9Q0UE73_9ROSI|nr:TRANSCRIPTION FACTOR GTE11 [Salix koriyanagi]KAJ6728392.1 TRANSCRIPTION FACTOR GTE11 [Salix koriyanagi]
MIAAGSVVMKKLTIKIASQRIEVFPGKMLDADEQSCSVSVGENPGSQTCNSDIVKQKYAVSGSRKRGLPKMKECQQKKRQKMDRGVTQQCSALLKSLMVHPAGWVFNNPVDPVALNIPDYFSIISNPMDLGTVKSKLGKNCYASIKEFADDIKLAFSNAMLYNPPTNNVHKMAEELNGIFEKRWKALEEKLNQEGHKFGSGKSISGQTTQIIDASPNCPRTPPLHSNALPKKSKPSEEKVMRCSSNAKPTKPAEVCKSHVPNSYKGTKWQCSVIGTVGGGRHACISKNVKPLVIPVAPNCSSCGSNTCQCTLQSDSNHTNSDISYERSSGRDQHACSTDTSKLEKTMPVPQMSKSDPDSDGAVSVLDDENICPSSKLTTPTADAASGEDWSSLFDVPLSPTKALRYATIKRRFADTILKAQNKAPLRDGDKADPMKMRQEKERLERRQREEKSLIEAQIRAAEAASRRREEMDLKRQREREREAARIALQKMERTVEIEQNLDILKELERLCGCSTSFNFRFGRVKMEVVKKGESGACIGSPLERLGLFMKDDIEDEDGEFLGEDGEEGEILC